MPKVSVVIPVYNAARFLPQCLDSLCSQTYQDMEILCVNDGSTDCSLEILEEYGAKDKRIRIFSKKNEGRGAASARNLGLEHAEGTYVQFVDSDDFFEPDMVQALVEKAEKVNADVVVCRADCYDEALGKTVGEFRTIELERRPEKDPFSFRDCPERIFHIGEGITWNKLYRRSLLEQYDLKYEAIPITDDHYVALLSLVFAERITCVDRVLVHYRMNTGQSQCDTRARHPEGAYAASYSIVARLREAGIYETVKRGYLNLAVRLMRVYFDQMTDYQTLRSLHDTYRDEMFPLLDAVDLPEDYFFDPRLGEWYRMVISHSLEEILFMAARGYGCEMTTAVLRFPAPFDRVRKGSRIVLVGRGMAGRYWYVQFLLSGHCEVVCWVDREEQISPELSFDSIIIAK